MARKIDAGVKRFSPRFGYDGYLAKFPDGCFINFRISWNVLDEPKLETKDVILGWGREGRDEWKKWRVLVGLDGPCMNVHSDLRGCISLSRNIRKGRPYFLLPILRPWVSAPGTGYKTLLDCSFSSGFYSSSSDSFSGHGDGIAIIIWTTGAGGAWKGKWDTYREACKAGDNKRSSPETEECQEYNQQDKVSHPMIKGLLTNGIDIGTVGVLTDETLSQESQKFWMTFWIRKREREKGRCRVCWKWFELICPATNIGCTMLIWKNIAEWRRAEWISHPASGGKFKSLQKPIMAFNSVLFNKLEGSPIQDVRFTQILPASHDPPSFPYDLLGNWQVAPSLAHPVPVKANPFIPQILMRRLGFDFPSCVSLTLISWNVQRVNSAS